MARLCVTKASGRPASSSADPANQTALAAAMAVLVADAAAPTQAHVNTANAALTAITPATGSIVLSIDTSVYASMNAVKSAVADLLAALQAMSFPEA